MDHSIEQKQFEHDAIAHRREEIWSTYQVVKQTIDEYHDITYDTKYKDSKDPEVQRLDEEDIVRRLQEKWGTAMGIRKVLMGFSVALEAIVKHEQPRVLNKFLEDYGHWLWDNVEYIISPNEEPPLPVGPNDERSHYDHMRPGDYQGDWAYCCWSYYETFEEWSLENSGNEYWQ